MSKRPKAYEVVLVDLNPGTPMAVSQHIDEVVIRVRTGDVESAIKFARKVVAKSWAYTVVKVAPANTQNT